MFVYRTKCPAKVNLCLSVLGRDTESGLHLIDTVIAKINLYDELELKITEASGIRTSFKWAWPNFEDKTLSSDDNSIIRAYKELDTMLGFTLPGMEVQVLKRIPAGSGLGGASTDAAGFIKLVLFIAKKTQVFKKRLTERISSITRNKLNSIAFRVGADVPAFLTGGTVRVRGFGEVVESVNLSSLSDYSIILIIPKTRLSTREMYARLSAILMAEGQGSQRKSGRRNQTAEFLSTWLAKGAEKAFAVARNDFEELACQMCEAVADTLRILRKQGYPFVSITGSGSGVIGVKKKDQKICLPEELPKGAKVLEHQFLP